MNDRQADFLERISTISGKTTYRTPNEGRSTAPLAMTDCDIASSLAYARKGSSDIGPDIAYAIACQSDAYRPRIVADMARAVAATQGHGIRHMRNHTLAIADAAYGLLVWKNKPAPPNGVTDKDRYLGLVAACAAIMDEMAWEAVRRAARAYYGRA